MSKEIRIMIWTLTGLIMILFSCLWIKDATAGHLINLLASLIMAQQIIKAFNDGSKKVVFWEAVGVAAFLVNALIDLIQLSI